MTDLEKVKRCAERMRYSSAKLKFQPRGQLWVEISEMRNELYNPLTNKAQAFELVERLDLNIETHGAPTESYRAVYTQDYNGDDRGTIAHNADLCRAIVDCASQLPGESK